MRLAAGKFSRKIFWGRKFFQKNFSPAERVGQMTSLLEVRTLFTSRAHSVGCRDAFFTLWPGAVLGILGESGSGKSALLDWLAGHLPQDTGEAIFDSRTTEGPRDGLRMRISAGGNAGERLTASGARPYGQVRGAAADCQTRVEIDTCGMDDRPSGFSGGMQQRLVGSVLQV